MTGLLFLDDTALAALSRNPAVTREFPFLAAPLRQQPKKKCNSCGRKTRPSLADYSAVRKQIAALPIDQKAKLKRLLGAPQVSLIYVDTRGRRVKLKF